MDKPKARLRWDLFAASLAGFRSWFARQERTRVHHPHEPGTDPRDDTQRFDRPI